MPSTLVNLDRVPEGSVSQSVLVESRELLKCSCGSTWFEEYKVSQFVDKEAGLGMSLMKPGISIDIVVYKCFECRCLSLPKVDYNYLRKEQLQVFESFANYVDEFNKSKKTVGEDV